jgi:hypothetical protein
LAELIGRDQATVTRWVRKYPSFVTLES